MLQFHRGQGMEIWWRENFVSPSEEEYRQMVTDKSGSLFSLAVRLMQLFSPMDDAEQTSSFEHLCHLLSLFFQIRDDYCNLISTRQPSNKAFCEDLTEGKFSFPILHAVNTRENDTRIIHILKQRTQDPKLKEYCVRLFYEFGSMEYTRQTCTDLVQKINEEIAHHNGNVYLENLIQRMMIIFSSEDEPERRASDHIDDEGVAQIKTNGVKKIPSKVNEHCQHWYVGLKTNPYGQGGSSNIVCFDMLFDFLNKYGCHRTVLLLASVSWLALASNTPFSPSFNGKRCNFRQTQNAFLNICSESRRQKLQATSRFIAHLTATHTGLYVSPSNAKSTNEQKEESRSS